MANEYCTLNYAKALLEPELTDPYDDGRLWDMISAASRAIDAECNRFFYQKTSTAIVIEPGGSVDELYLGRDLVSIDADGLQVDADGDGTYETTWTATDFELGPLGADVTGHPYHEVRAVGDYYFPTHKTRRARVKITGTWGWPSVPQQIQHAAGMLAVRLLKRANSPLGIAGFSPEVPVYVRHTDPDIARFIHPLRKIGVA